jgi:hypothetical protein
MATGWRRVVHIVGAALAGLVAVPTVLALVLFWVVSPLEGCELGFDIGPTDAAVSATPDGRVVVHPGPGHCGSRWSTQSIQSVRLTTADGTVAWQADGTAGADGNPDTAPPFDLLVVGQAPPGFADTVPLAAALDPTTTYTVEMSVLAATLSAGSPTSTGYDLYPMLGQTARFRPADLSTTTVWYQGQATTPAEFDRAPARPGPSPSASPARREVEAIAALQVRYCLEFRGETGGRQESRQ